MPTFSVCACKGNNKGSNDQAIVLFFTAKRRIIPPFPLFPRPSTFCHATWSANSRQNLGEIVEVSVLLPMLALSEFSVAVSVTRLEGLGNPPVTALIVLSELFLEYVYKTGAIAGSTIPCHFVSIDAYVDHKCIATCAFGSNCVSFDAVCS